MKNEIKNKKKYKKINQKEKNDNHRNILESKIKEFKNFFHTIKDFGLEKELISLRKEIEKYINEINDLEFLSILIDDEEKELENLLK